MASYRHTHFFAVGAILVWLLYFSRGSAFLSHPPDIHHYDGHIHTDAEIDSILAADATATGSSQLKHHDSWSANRYDVLNTGKPGKHEQASLNNEKKTGPVPAKTPQKVNGLPSSGNGKKPAAKAAPGGRIVQKPKKLNLFSETFPRQIWQYSSPTERTANTEKVVKWESINKNLEHLWLSDDKADHFVRSTFASSRKHLVTVWDEVSSGYKVDPTLATIRSNLLKYLVLYIHGGIYTDIDTMPLIHADRYIPTHMTNQEIDAIIGLDFEHGSSVGFLISTLVSKMHHPLFEEAAERVVSNLEYLKRSQGVSSVAQLKLSNTEVDAATGSVMFTEVALHLLQNQAPKKIVNARFFQGMTEPRLVGDVLVLPVGAFNAQHKLDPYGGEMVGLQGVRLVMRADAVDALKPLKEQDASGTLTHTSSSTAPAATDRVRSQVGHVQTGELRRAQILEEGNVRVEARNVKMTWQHNEH